MNRIWYIFIEDKEEGPFSVDELKNEPRLTPDTLVWKEGFKNWIPIRHVPELQIIFKDEEITNPEEDERNTKLNIPPFSKPENDQLILDMRSYPPLLWWMLIVFLIFCYILWLQS